MPDTAQIVDLNSAPKDVTALCKQAVQASLQLRSTTAAQRSEGLRRIAEEIRSGASAIVEANKKDLQAAEEAQLSAAMVDRLLLDSARIEGMASAVQSIAKMRDCIGERSNESVRPNGLRVAKVRIPLGVVAMIYESRPNVTSDAGALCLRTANAVILRGGKEAFHSNQAIGHRIRAALRATGLPENAVQVLATTDRQTMGELLLREEEIDLVIPRGGEALIRYVSEHSRIPVIKHYKGVCHVYVHEEADIEKALSIALNAKASRPGVCNAAETLLVDQAIASTFLPKIEAEFASAGVEMRTCERGKEWLPGAKVATEADWEAEYLDKIIAIRVVDDLEAALAHIERYGSNHTEAILTENPEVASRFTAVVNSSTVIVNASTRFADGGELGLGAEIGISTSKLHAYGPMGAEGLTTTKFLLEGNGQIRP